MTISPVQIPFSPALFHAQNDSYWYPLSLPSVRMHHYYIPAPASPSDREAWLSNLREYRQRIREGAGDLVARVNSPVGAWIYMSMDLARIYDVRPGEKALAVVEVRLTEGHGEMGVSFNVHDRETGSWVAWPRPGGSLQISASDDWQRLEAEITVPEFDPEKEIVCPMFNFKFSDSSAGAVLDVRRIDLNLSDTNRMSKIKDFVKPVHPEAKLDLSVYDRDDLQWASSSFACHFTFMYDLSFYDPKSGTYNLDEFLNEGEGEFGGYDSMVFWHAYPRIGIDDRNQFDFYRDMPGGLDGLRSLVRQAHARGVKVFINYNPWDLGTRREDKTDEEALAEVIAATEADGIFLDTMGGGSGRLRSEIDALRKGVIFEPEGHPAIHQLGICSASWGQHLEDPVPPGLLHLKWIEPRHMQHQIHRWDTSHRGEIETAFFNGSGMMIWENVFGSYNPWNDEDRALWRRASRILRRFFPLFSLDDWDPYYPAAQPQLFINRWPSDGIQIFTMLNYGAPIKDQVLLEVSNEPNCLYYDLWNGTQLFPDEQDGKVRIKGSMERMGCLLAIRKDVTQEDLPAFVEEMRTLSEGSHNAEKPRNFAFSVVDPVPVAPTAKADKAPSGMVKVESHTFTMCITHEARECNCYPDPITSKERWPEFLLRHHTDQTLHHKIGPITLPSFYIDEACVTNKEFQRFLRESGYRPKHPENFLKHWGGGMPEELAEYPAIYVDLEDARAYARWAGKRLPTEAEWHLAAQGTDERDWPWGSNFDASKCNTSGKLMPARSLPEGCSPCGCYHMSGNVWEWTESERSDGHTRFCIVRGGSYFQALGSVWYMPGGPRPNTYHAKFIQMWPGLDRCGTIGFRCVVDAKS